MDFLLPVVWIVGLYWIFRIWIVGFLEMDVGWFQGYGSGLLDLDFLVVFRIWIWTVGLGFFWIS
jgi:hypothetical protein